MHFLFLSLCLFCLFMATPATNGCFWAGLKSERPASQPWQHWFPVTLLAAMPDPKPTDLCLYPYGDYIGFLTCWSTMETLKSLSQKWYFFSSVDMHFYHFIYFFIFKATPATFGSSLGRGQIRATAAGLHHSHSNARSEPRLKLTPQLKATPHP